YRRRQAAEAPDGEEADLVAHHPPELACEVPAQEGHEPVHLARRALPVLGRERVQGEVADAELAAHLDDRAHGVLPHPVPLEAREAALLCPAPVAVHDDGHVARQVCGIDLDHQTAMISSSFCFKTFSTRST